MAERAGVKHYSMFNPGSIYDRLAQKDNSIIGHYGTDPGDRRKLKAWDFQERVRAIQREEKEAKAAGVVSPRRLQALQERLEEQSASTTIPTTTTTATTTTATSDADKGGA